MNGLSPVVRNLIVSEDIQTNPANPREVTLVNLLSAIRSLEQPAFPLLHRELCIFVQLSDCRGSGEIEVRIAHADSGEWAYPGPSAPWKAMLPNDPLEVVGLPFRIRNVEFAEPGLYWIQFWYNGDVLAQQPLLLR